LVREVMVEFMSMMRSEWRSPPLPCRWPPLAQTFHEG
jgi:hypothetical protein